MQEKARPISNPTIHLITEKQQTNGITRSSSTGIISQISSSNDTATIYHEQDNNNEDSKIISKEINPPPPNSLPSSPSPLTIDNHDHQQLNINNNNDSNSNNNNNDNDNNNNDNNNNNNNNIENENQIEKEKEKEKESQPLLENNASETKTKTTDGIRVYWKYGGNQVYLTGSFDQWKKTIQMVKQENGEFLGIIPSSSPGKPIYYKFIVDDVWRNDNDQPTEKDSDGNINNVIYT
ncbi:immunoglobulin E-set [Cunninghamella echinulata]|nr:immunoglobulin E-set [Cunninghamella echinulata]